MRLRPLFLYCILLLLSGKIYAQSPLEFIENKGQWGDWFRYKVATQGGEVCLENDGFRYILSDYDNNYKMDYYHHGQTTVKPILKFHAYKVTFVGADRPEIKGERPQKIYYNYFLGDDTSNWKSGIHPYRGVDYNKLYRGIDMNVFSSRGNLEYEFIVQPNADVTRLKLKFEGQDDIRIKDHNLVISTTAGQVTEMKPYAFQYINDDKVEVPCEYRLRDNVLTYTFPKDYDHSQRLIIDPVVVLCTLTGSTADNWGYSATYDDQGNFYAGGLVNCFAYAGSHFPVSPGAFQLTFGGGYGTAGPSTGYAYAADISIIKYDATLANRIYATYLGGTGNDHVHSMIVDQAGNLAIAGRTRSLDYPVTSGAYQTVNHGGWDIVVTKFNAAGTALIGSTYIGGSGEDGVNFDSTEYTYGQLKYNYGDDSRSEIQLDKSGNLYVASCTQSTNFPTTPTAISTTLSGLQDGVVFKLNGTLSSLIWSTYFGGTGSDAGYVLAFDTSQTAVYVAGGTNSTNFPSTPGTLNGSYQGGTADGYILKFNNNTPYNLLKGTYIGTANYDQVYGIQVSYKDEVYVMGQSLGGVFPVTAGAHSNPGSNQFVMKLDRNLSTDMASTVFGSGVSAQTNISPVAFLVDTCENVYISGWGGDLGIAGVQSGLCNGMETSVGAFQTTTDGRDFYFIVFGSGLTSLRYATYYGRNCGTSASYFWEGEHVDGGTSRFDKHGIIYQGICANCGGTYPRDAPVACPAAFPTTSGVWSETDSSHNCNEAALKVAFNIGPVHADVVAGPNTEGCAPLTVNFTNLSNNGLSFTWDFGDGTGTTSTFSPTHTFNSAGTFTVTLYASNSNACFKTSDTAHLIIRVDTNYITPSFTHAITDSCGPFIVTLNNTSVTHVSSDTSTFQWYWGDGNTYFGNNPPLHNYTDTGSYTIMLIMSNAGACKSPDTLTQRVHITYSRVSAKFAIPDSLCVGTSFTPTVTITNATSILWNFGDGHTSSVTAPTYKFDNAGTYIITLIVKNPGACNGADTLIDSIKVLTGPIADFSFVPLTPIPNVPTTYTNLSVNATKYSWDFGDNTTSNETNPVHQFNKTGYYKTCLTAVNSSSCPSTVCKQVPADVLPLIGLPTAFSPNGDGENDILYVRGAAIQTLDLKIYNRWGQLVFETRSQEKGWDGTFNGEPQPIEAYAYVLSVTFIDGTAKLLKGNITLLR
jgi:gliding motility-associated-like protein